MTEHTARLILLQ